ncbi:MAG: NAD(P)/FAD-dependent oxidoreductase [Actinophytocola sp.]|nr:NAD(P)/FAD-dependent oxidoreductase [Actinophytocola sp.]
MRTMTVVGASLAGVNSVQQLRQQGFDGRIVVVGEETHRPYDRPPLSKALLAGRADVDDLWLCDEEDQDELGAEWRLGVRAEQLDPAAGRVRLSDGAEIDTDGVVIATGGRARRLPGIEDMRGLHTVRTIEDALALRAELTGGAGEVVVVGAGWIGAEIASTCHELGLRVTLVESGEVPLSRTLGDAMGSVFAALHTDHGVSLRCRSRVSGLTNVADGDGRRVTGVWLDDGTQLPADVVVMGVGIQPVTEWLAGSGVAVDDGVLCDPGCVTELPSVVAVGDVARYRTATGGTVRHEHWNNAAEQSATAIRNLLAGSTIEHYRPSGYVWSDQYGVRLQIAGELHQPDEVEVVDGSPSDRRFVVAYRRSGETVGVLAMNNPKLFIRMRKQLAGRLATS